MRLGSHHSNTILASSLTITILDGYHMQDPRRTSERNSFGGRLRLQESGAGLAALGRSPHAPPIPDLPHVPGFPHPAQGWPEAEVPTSFDFAIV